MLQYFFDDKYLNVRLTTIYVLTKMKNKHVNGLHQLYIIVKRNIGQLIFLREFSYFTCIYDDLMILMQQHI